MVACRSLSCMIIVDYITMIGSAHLLVIAIMLWRLTLSLLSGRLSTPMRYSLVKMHPRSFAVMSKNICKYCACFDPDPNVNFCQCMPYPRPSDNYCCCVDFDGCSSPDLFDCPDCVFALQGKFCVRGHVGGGQSICPYYQSCYI